MTAPKQFGLILSKKSSQKTVGVIPRGSVFGDSDDDESKGEKISAHGVSFTSQSQRMAKAARTAAIADDPTVFQYDEVYDDMKAGSSKQRTESDEAKRGEEQRKPKYMAAVIKAATKRQHEHEARIERKAKREREEEGAEFADSEVFVTDSYRKKMEEIRQHEEQERKEELLNEMTSGVKHKHMAGFYRHLLSQQLREEVIVEKKEAIPVSSEETTGPVSMKKPVQDLKNRRYREKRPSSPKSDSDTETAKKDTTIKREVSEEPAETDVKPVVKEEPEAKKRNIYFSESEESSPPDETPPPSPGLKLMKKRHDSPAPDIFDDSEASRLKRLESLKQYFTKHNDEQSIEAYRKRYFERQSNAVVSVG